MKSNHLFWYFPRSFLYWAAWLLVPMNSTTPEKSCKRKQKMKRIYCSNLLNCLNTLYVNAKFPRASLSGITVNFTCIYYAQAWAFFLNSFTINFTWMRRMALSSKFFFLLSIWHRYACKMLTWFMCNRIHWMEFVHEMEELHQSKQITIYASFHIVYE